MIILGIDPGLCTTGFGKLLCPPGRTHTAPRVLEAGVLRTRASDPLERRLDTLFSEMSQIVTDADVVVVESLFSVYEHPRTAILMGHARGALLLACARAGKRVIGYTPLRVKKAVSGYGRATKEQMQRAVQSRLGLKTLPEPADVADALALALCHANVVDHGMDRP